MFFRCGSWQYESQAVSEQLQDKPKDQGKELVKEILSPKEKNLAAQGEEPRVIFISANLLVELKMAVLNLLQKFKDVFAWTYSRMPGLNPQLVMHRLNISEGSKLTRQVLGNFRPTLEV